MDEMSLNDRPPTPLSTPKSSSLSLWFLINYVNPNNMLVMG